MGQMQPQPKPQGPRRRHLRSEAPPRPTVAGALIAQNGRLRPPPPRRGLACVYTGAWWGSGPERGLRRRCSPSKIGFTFARAAAMAAQERRTHPGAAPQEMAWGRCADEEAAKHAPARPGAAELPTAAHAGPERAPAGGEEAATPPPSAAAVGVRRETPPAAGTAAHATTRRSRRGSTQRSSTTTTDAAAAAAAHSSRLPCFFFSFILLGRRVL